LVGTNASGMPVDGTVKIRKSTLLHRWLWMRTMDCLTPMQILVV
jgi:hypothetical protein